jgi:hypothetical protein
MDVDVNEVGAMDVSPNGAQRSDDERNRPQRRPRNDYGYQHQRHDDRATIVDVDVNEVGAMDVSRNGAQRSDDERNRPQRQPCDNCRYGVSATTTARRL